MENEAVIKVKNLSTSFEDSLVLDDVSFEAYANQITIILGKSGCGKTTLLKNLIGLYNPTGADVQVMGYQLRDIEERYYQEFAMQMGVLYQNGALINSLTIAENIAVPLQQHTSLPLKMIDKLIRVKLHLVGLENVLHLFPAQLSGGMRKRAALARALALDPPLLFCDEPSAGLDPVTLEALDKLILKMRDRLGMTIVLVTHEIPSIFRLADRIVFLDKGKVAFNGTLSAALKSGHPAIHEFFSKGDAANS